MSELPGQLNGRSVSRYYGELAGEERFRLMLEARVRGDDTEVGRLRDHTPRLRFAITDPDYMDRIEASRDLATTFVLFTEPLLAELRAMRATRQTLGTYIAVGLGAQIRASMIEDGLLPDEEDGLSPERAAEIASEVMDEKFTEAEAALVGAIAPVYAGFAQACRGEMGLEPELVLRGHHLDLVCSLDILKELGALKPERKAAAAWAETFRQEWAARVIGVDPYYRQEAMRIRHGPATQTR
jgi:hypothetical protein